MRISRQIFFVLGAHLLVLALLLAGCGYAERKDPPLYTYDSAALVQESARLQARDVGGWVTGPNVCCGSMLPLIRAGDFLVVRPSVFSGTLTGRVVVYAPKWNAGRYVVHRLVSGDARAGFIASGDNNARSEAFELVTAATYVGEVVGIYRLSP